jgi:hypothetical protein
MLFSYTYVPHQMETMQAFIDFIFHEVWCKAPIGLAFHPDLFADNPDLREVMAEFGFSRRGNASERGKAFYKDVKAIYELFEPLSAGELDQFKRWYQGNNDLDRVCANDPRAQLARYADISMAHPLLSKQLKGFFKELFSPSLLTLKVLQDKIGKIDDHYQAFYSANSSGKCPFCGIADMNRPPHKAAYDHYLPKGLYPFNSVNFRNLAPACHECNSTYKHSKDPAHNSAGRRRAFNPYGAVGHTIEIHVTLHHPDVENLTHADITLQFGPAEVAEEIETWTDVYGIDRRYKDKLCAENDGKFWLVRVLQEGQAYDKQPGDILNMLAQQAQSYPFADYNFLRKPFLDACKEVGAL